jgi:hypothetical protein
MEKLKIPQPEVFLNYKLHTKEDFQKLRVIDVLWLLSVDTYGIAGRGIGIKFETFQARMDKNPSKEKEILDELIGWIKKYTHNDDPLWLFLEKNYGQTIPLFLKDFAKFIGLVENDPSFLNNISKEKQQFLKRLIYSGFFKSIKNETSPSIWQIIKAIPLFLDFGKTFGFEEKGYPNLIPDFINFWFSIFSKDGKKILTCLQVILKNIFGQYAFEIYTHYLLNWMNQEQVFTKVFPNFDDKYEQLNNLSITEEKANIDSFNDNNWFESLTESQIVLLHHFFLTYINQRYKKGVDLTVVARFIAMVAGKRISKIKNSNIYTYLREAPNLKIGKGLLKDLKTVRDFLEKNELKDILQLVDIEIDVIQK